MALEEESLEANDPQVYDWGSLSMLNIFPFRYLG